MSKYSLVLILLVCAACTEPKKEKEIQWTQEQSTELNKNLAIEEDLNIRMFLANRKTWKTVKTGTGLRYYIYHQGTGMQAVSGMQAEVKYKVSLLDGTQCYQTDTLETEKFEIDHSEVESGVQEGIKKMKVGDKAKMIIPSHLAHGLTGNQDKIPPLTTLIIDLELVSLNR